MVKSDVGKFTILMNAIGEACPGKLPSPEKTKIYFDALRDMEYEEIEKRMTQHLRFSDFFPTIKSIRQEADPELLAQKDVAMIEEMCQEFIFPDFPMVGRNIIYEKLKQRGQEDLIYLVDRHGAEICNGQLSTVVRAQMIKGHKASITQKLLTGKPIGQLNPKLDKLIDKITGEK